MKSKNLHVGTWRIWGPALGWAAVIFVCSSLPGTAYPRTDVPAADKLVHLFLYGALGALCARALILRAARPEARLRLRLVLAAAALATAYGITDELHQLFVPFRSADWQDVIADAIGGLIGATLARWRCGRG
jgi:VanZ family protein